MFAALRWYLQLDARAVAQVDVKKDTNRPSKSAENDKFKDLTFVRRQCREMTASDVLLALQFARRFMMRNRPFDCGKQFMR